MKPLRILVVDDDDLARMSVAGFLRSRGYEVSVAGSGKEGLEAAVSSDADIALLDVILGDMDGLDVCAELMRRAPESAPTVLMLSGLRFSPEDQRRGIEAGAVEYLLKPIENRDLLARIKAIEKLLVAKREREERRKALMDELERRAAENELLLRELFHRTRNNMQVIIGLLALEAEETDCADARSLVERTHDRILVMSLVHKRLAESKDLSSIDLAEYFADILALVRAEDPEKAAAVRLELAGPAIRAVIDEAVPFGLAFHELVSLAFAQASPLSAAGVLKARLDGDGMDGVELMLTAEGIVFAGPGPDPRRVGFGERLVRSLVAGQLKGEADMGDLPERPPVLRFKLRRELKRV